MSPEDKIVITGGAGLVGQNLVVALRQSGHRNLVVMDKSHYNLGIMRRFHPGVTTIEADLSKPGDWQQVLANADVVVMLHAQIGGIDAGAFTRNNVTATRHVLDAIAGSPGCYLLHVSSSVVKSAADDHYTRTKEEQEQMVMASNHPWCVLRPTLMFGWFDRKHFGWLSRFMQRTPLFPIPGDGNYLRQPLYAGDFCRLLMNCLETRPSGKCFNISGKEKVPYIDIIRGIRRTLRSRCLIVRLPVSTFTRLLEFYARFDRNPPFTTRQLEALVIDETFEDWDWEARFGVTATPLEEALESTFRDPRYSGVVLEF